VPETYVVGGDGLIYYRHAGPLTEEDYRKVIKPLLAELRR
jgi:cytochrome c biogenesis protein CcmG, thiol:disulfide interchange protein DsbE